MEFLKELHKRTLLIVPPTVKQKILLFMDKQHLFFPFKLMTLKEIRNNLYFETDENAICFLQKKYKIKREVAKLYLENLYYIDEQKETNMEFLRSMKETLEKEGLLLYNPTFYSYLKNTLVLLYGYDILTQFDQKMIEELKRYTEVQYREPMLYPLTEAYKCLNMEEQIKCIFEEIASLVAKGVSLDKIYLVNVQKEMYRKIKRIAKNYHIPLQKEKKYLYATPIYKKIKEAILKGDFASISSPYMEELLHKLNQIHHLERYSLDVLLDGYAKEICITEEEGIFLQIEPLLDNVFEEEDYVFILNANASFLPKTYRDEDFLYDAIKPSILEDTNTFNLLTYQGTKKAIEKIKNKKVYFIQEDEGVFYYPSALLDDTLIYEREPLYISHYSHIQNKCNLLTLLDRHRKYGTSSSSFLSLKNNYSLSYLSYDNAFKGVVQKDWLAFLKHPFLLSYSALNCFYECSFKYYLQFVLKLNPSTFTFSSFLGTLFHTILKEKPQNIQEYTEHYLKENNIVLSKQESFYLKQNLLDLNKTLSFYEEFKTYSSFNEEEVETKVFLPFDNKCNVTFMGIIDKKWIDTEHNLAVIIDYKTGNTHFNLKDCYYGLNMQLPIYYYIARKSDDKKKVIGFYLQNILEKNFRYKKNKTEEEQKKDSLKLNGYSLSDSDLLLHLDETIVDSRFIKGMKISKNGFYPYSKVLSEQDLDALCTLVEEKIEQMIEEITEAHFTINPKKLRNENVSCPYCPYRSICFQKEKDIIELKEKEDLSFLGGDSYAKMDN